MVLLIKDAAAFFVKWGPSEILNENAAAALYISKLYIILYLTIHHLRTTGGNLKCTK